MTLAEFMATKGLKDDDLTETLGVGRSMVTKLRLRIAKPSYDVMHKLNAFADGAITVPEMAPTTHEACQPSVVEPSLSSSSSMSQRSTCDEGKIPQVIGD
jgi:hypothetical protein